MNSYSPEKSSLFNEFYPVDEFHLSLKKSCLQIKLPLFFNKKSLLKNIGTLANTGLKGGTADANENC